MLKEMVCMKFYTTISLLDYQWMSLPCLSHCSHSDLLFQVDSSQQGQHYIQFTTA